MRGRGDWEMRMGKEEKKERKEYWKGKKRGRRDDWEMRRGEHWERREELKII